MNRQSSTLFGEHVSLLDDTLSWIISDCKCRYVLQGEVQDASEEPCDHTERLFNCLTVNKQWFQLAIKHLWGHYGTWDTCMALLPGDAAFFVSHSARPAVMISYLVTQAFRTKGSQAAPEGSFVAAKTRYRRPRSQNQVYDSEWRPKIYELVCRINVEIKYKQHL